MREERDDSLVGFKMTEAVFMVSVWEEERLLQGSLRENLGFVSHYAAITGHTQRDTHFTKHG